MNKEKLFAFIALIELFVIIYFVVKSKKTIEKGKETGEERDDLEKELENTKNRYKSILAYCGIDPEEAEANFDKSIQQSTGGIAAGLI